MFVIVTTLSIIILAATFNLGVGYFLFSLIGLISIYFLLLYFPAKYKLNYYSWFTAIVSLMLVLYLLAILYYLT